MRRLIQSAILVLTLALSLSATTALAATNVPASQSGCNSNTPSLTSGISCGAPSSASSTSLFNATGPSLFRSIADTLIIVIGAIAVIMVIIGGLRYVLSVGSPQATAGAKDQILYAVIGVIVAILAYSIVNFVVGRIG